MKSDLPPNKESLVENRKRKIISESFILEWKLLTLEDLNKMTYEQINIIFNLVEVFKYKRIPGDKKIPKLVTEKVLTRSFLLNQFLQGDQKSFYLSVLMKLLKDSYLDLDIVNFLIEQKILTEKTLSNAIQDSSLFYRAIDDDMFPWRELIEKKIIIPENFNTLNLGIDINKVPEYEAFIEDLLLSGSSHANRYGIGDENDHLLLKHLRGTEKRETLSRQISQALGGDKKLINSNEGLQKVWEYYFNQSAKIKKLNLPQVSPEERLANVKKVNERQIKFIQRQNGRPRNMKYFDPNKKYFDIYGRYGHGRMDPSQLAVITKTIEWYVETGRSKLFTDVRLVSDRPQNILQRARHRMRHTAWIAKSVYPKIKVIYPEGKDFIDSMIGASRFFLTNANARDAEEVGCISLVTKPIYNNVSKMPIKHGKAILFDADFDKQDPSRPDYHMDLESAPGVEGDILKLIEETIIKIRKLEDAELAQ